MHKKESALSALLLQKLLPLYFHPDAANSIRVLRALYAGGIRIVEYTNRGEAALDNFRELRKAVDAEMPGLQLGIGTIKTKKAARKFIEAGADFIVAPTMNEAVAEVVEDEDLLWIPGCMTPTEIAAAESAGATLVKIFPGNILGPGFVTAVRELFPGMQFMPTGGVEAEEGNLRSWFRSGVVAVGMGSKLVSREFLENGDSEGLQRAAEAALKLVHAAAV